MIHHEVVMMCTMINEILNTRRNSCIVSAKDLCSRALLLTRLQTSLQEMKVKEKQ